MEKLGLQTWGGKVKSIGAILCVGGAIATSIYKGHEFYIGHKGHHTPVIVVVAHTTNKLRGTLFLVKLLKLFPFKYWGTMLQCVMAAILSSIIGVCIDSNQASWRLQWNLELIAIVYSGALSTAATFCLLSWAITIKGPTYPSMFNPLALVFVALSEAFFLGESLKLGVQSIATVPSSSPKNIVVVEIDDLNKPH
ncbi:putative EamA domain-containing protein [Lupinus albus]|uniref:WAT1-related protein n=1 Tax=Lupinus albus TaxID=3870 RepID=A0A6A4P6G0_LUPAL|nr:putative EamA domain-containing protein [Lupinus albus]